MLETITSAWQGLVAMLGLAAAQAWLWVGLIGFGVGSVELIARYRDDPLRAILTLPALTYIFLNVIACVTVLAVLHIVRPEWLFPTNPSPGDERQQWLVMILAAGFGAVALFRSSLFRIKAADGDLAIGPSIILDTLLAASDRGVDRMIAAPRGEAIAALMGDVSFDRAKTALPSYCFALMQNVGQQEQKAFSDQVNALSSVPMDDRIRALNLGLALVNVVGERVLTGAVKDLRDLIKADPPVQERKEAKVAALMANVDFDKAKVVLPIYCFSLAPSTPASSRSALAETIDTLASSGLPQRVRSVTFGLALAQLVGVDVLTLAVEQLDADIRLDAAPRAQA